MVKIYRQPFAHEGTKQVIPDSSDPQGFVSNDDGFTSDYELPDTDPNYKPIERTEFNGLMNMVTAALGEIQQFGFAKWQPMTWPKGARVVEDGIVYRALVQTSKRPPHADWEDVLAIGTGNQLLSANGYKKLPGGLIIQWGAAIGSQSQITVSYPIAFPNAVLNRAVTLADKKGGEIIGLTLFSTDELNSNSQVGAILHGYDTGVWRFRYIAIGY